MTGAVAVAPVEDDGIAWDAFVNSSRDGSFFHLYGWKRVIERAYGYRGCYLAAKRGDRIVGILPMIDVRSPILGRALISTAFTVGGGIAAIDDEVRHALAEAALREGRVRNARYIEMRAPVALLPEWPVKSDVYASFRAPLILEDVAALKAVPRKRRAEIRKAIDLLNAGGLAAAWSKELSEFYPLFAHAMREHGTPVFSKRFAAALLTEFAGHTEILTIRSGGEPVLSLLSFTFKDAILPYYFGAGRRARDSRAYDLAIWLTMRRAAAAGAATFDFGRSKYGTGSFAYKTHWGFEPTPLEYQYALLSAKSPPNVSPTNPKFAIFAAGWRFLPLPLANIAGPLLARHLA